MAVAQDRRIKRGPRKVISPDLTDHYIICGWQQKVFDREKRDEFTNHELLLVKLRTRELALIISREGESLEESACHMLDQDEAKFLLNNGLVGVQPPDYPYCVMDGAHGYPSMMFDFIPFWVTNVRPENGKTYSYVYGAVNAAADSECRLDVVVPDGFPLSQKQQQELADAMRDTIAEKITKFVNEADWPPGRLEYLAQEASEK